MAKDLREIIDSFHGLEVVELEKLKTIIETLIVLGKEIEDVNSGRLVKLQQGKKQPIVMLDSEGKIVQEFKGFNACSKYLKAELGVRNEQNKLRKALDEGSELAGHTFVLKPRD